MRTRSARGVVASVVGGFAALAASSCGGGAGGTGSGDTLPGAILVSFIQAGQDNLPLNRILEFNFSTPIDPASVNPDSLQIRSGGAYGLAVDGRYIVQGPKVYFEPKLPGVCDLSDSGFRPGTTYRVSIVGSPEEFAIRSLAGEPLKATLSASFSTRGETDADLLEDQVPNAAPRVLETSPQNGEHPDPALPPPSDVPPSVQVGPGNQVLITFSENIDPCTVTPDTVRFFQYARGNTASEPAGFSPVSDQEPGNPFSWGAGIPTSPPQRVNSSYVLTQTVLVTQLVITPTFGEFPDNALLAVSVTNNVRDFGQTAVVPLDFAFVTQNRERRTFLRVLEFDGDVPVDKNVTTADYNTARAPSKVQGYLLFAGDSDNGSNLLMPAGPEPKACSSPSFQPNDNQPDDLDTVTADITLDGGSTKNSCANTTDGSTAVYFEYRSFRVRAGRTVRVVGVNPVIFLVQGDAVIENGGRLLVHGDGSGGSLTFNGANGVANQQGSATRPVAGTGYVGGGSGGQPVVLNTSGQPAAPAYGDNGVPGFGSPDHGLSAGTGNPNDPVRQGQGRGGLSMDMVSYFANGQYQQRTAAGGGGGGHGVVGVAGGTVGTGNSPTFPDGNATDLGGGGGGTYGDPDSKMQLPEAGSGGGAGGSQFWRSYGSGFYFQSSGGAGGAGSGFVDLTSAGNILVYGQIDASGGRGGGGASSFYSSGSGAGGGSGGAVRLLTPGEIRFQSSTLVTTIGGAGGAGAKANFGSTATVNNGGMGGSGRLAFEDGDTVIGGYSAANSVPPEGQPGFYRGPFNAARFVGGGLRPFLLSNLMDMGPTFPDFQSPVQTYGGREDFVAGIPAVASRGIGLTSIFVEIQGFPVRPDGTADLTAPSGWKNVGYFKDSGAEGFPTWVPDASPPLSDVTTLPPQNTGGTIHGVDNREFCQFRITFYLRNGVGPFDPGPFIDRWTLNIDFDQ